MSPWPHAAKVPCPHATVAWQHGFHWTLAWDGRHGEHQSGNAAAKAILPNAPDHCVMSNGFSVVHGRCGATWCAVTDVVSQAGALAHWAVGLYVVVLNAIADNPLTRCCLYITSR